MTLSTRRLAGWLFTLILLSLSGFTAAAQNTPGGTTQVVTGVINDATPSKTYPIELQTGQALLVTSEATSGDLDTVLNLYEPGTHRIVANNDDRRSGNLDSAMGYVAVKAGTYTLELTRYEGTASAGNFRMEITIGDPSILSALDAITRVQLSGAAQTRDTAHYRLHYTFEGADRVTQDYVDQVASSVEEIYNIEINQMGWNVPPSDGVMGGGNGLYDVYMQDLIGGGEGALGYTSPESIVGDNPNTPAVEQNAATSYLVLENDFANVHEGNGNVISLMRTTFAHEFNHAIQFGYDSNDPHNWVYEATSSWMETAAVPRDQDATGYVSYAYQYPELCFGTTNDPGQGQLQYGEWTFLQYLVDRFGAHAPMDYWTNIAQLDGFAALQATLDEHSGGSVSDLFAGYRANDLARNYTFAPQFDATVWMENVISHPGRWTWGAQGHGVQELGANYYQVTTTGGNMYADLVNDNGALRLYGLGVANNEVNVIPLDRGGVINPQAYEYFYLMVFNPVWDETVNDCTYYSYQIDVTSSKGTPNPVTDTINGQYFQALH